MQSWNAFLSRCFLQNKLLKSVLLPLNYGRMSLHVFITWVYSTFTGEQILNEVLYCRHWDPIFNSAILNRDIKERKKVFRDTRRQRHFW